MAPPRLCLVGGFLGSGKTSLTLAAAERLEADGQTVAVVTNDHDGQLVDAGLVEARGLPGASIEGGCFSCRLHELVATLHEVAEETQPDVIFAEAVGTCTDLSATVLHPLRSRHPEAFDLAPITVVTEPRLVTGLMGQTLPMGTEDIRYLFGKQLEEADLVVLTKADAHDQRLVDQCGSALAQELDDRPVLVTSAQEGTGLDAWLDRLAADEPAGQHILDLADERYHAAEAEMAWLNATGHVSGRADQLAPALSGLVSGIVHRIGPGSVSHLKILLQGDEGHLWAAAAMGEDRATIRRHGDLGQGPWELRVNLRALTSPDHAEEVLHRMVAHQAPERGLSITFGEIERFRPASPAPTERVDAPVETGTTG